VETNQIASLLQPYIGATALSAVQLDYILTYVNILEKWNARANLSGIRDEAEIIRRHFGESFFAAAHLVGPDAAITAIDVGSGAGFPGLAMKIFTPQLHQTLIEAHGMKATFLREVVRALQLKGVKVFEGRAEAFVGTAELVTFRAVEKFEKILVSASKLVAPGGRLAILVGIAQIERARSILPGVWGEPIPIPCSDARTLAVWHSPAG
jgi:16S rRNA (guanine527-N7)-methyltransferase